MSLTLNRAGRRAFYASLRKSLFKRGLTQSQVRGLEAILTAFEDENVTVKEGGYMLATTYHETARTMQPIKEYGGRAYFMRMYDKTGRRPRVARVLGNTEYGDGAKFAGRGYVQLTGRTNYTKGSRKLGVPLATSPGLAMHPDVAAKIMIYGMREGWFTGRKLSHYFGKGKHDPINARRIINGTDKMHTIARYHTHFERALEAAHRASIAIPDETPEEAETPVVVPVKPEKPVSEAAGPVAVGGGAVAASQWAWWVAGIVLVVGAAGIIWWLKKKHPVEFDRFIDRRKIDAKRAWSFVGGKVSDIYDEIEEAI